MATPIKPQDTQEGCNPISSNCVIWQGPNIPCLSLCTGDSVSDVVAKLASELCTIIDELKISAYDLSCFDPMCPTPTSFQAMIQLLIDKVCALYNIDPTTSIAGCPDCEVNVATCLITKDNLGNDITTLQLKDYVILIGNKICTILTDIASQGTAIADLETRVTFIEDNCCNQSNVPTISTSCLNPAATNIPITSFVTALESAFCALQATTGTVVALQTAIGNQCPGLASEAPLDPASGAGTMSGIAGWVASPITVADSMTNMWLTICDMRAGLVDLIAQVNACCAVSCSSILLTFNATYDGNKNIQIAASGSFPPGFDFCTNSTVIVQGSNGSTVTYANVNLSIGTTNIDISSATVYNSLYYFVTVIGCYTDGDSQCTQTSEQFNMGGLLICPTITLSAGALGEVIWAFSSTAPASANVSYSVTLTNTATGTLVGAANVVSGPPGARTGSFTGLANTTNYTVSLAMEQGIYTKSCNTANATTGTPPPLP
jgi:hypothetical protein